MAKPVVKTNSKNKKSMNVVETIVGTSAIGTPEPAETLTIDRRPFSESLKNIGVQAKNWENLDGTAVAKSPAKPFSFKVLRPGEKIPKTGINWAKWFAIVGVVTILLVALQCLLITREMARIQANELKSLNKAVEKLSASVDAMKDRVVF